MPVPSWFNSPDLGLNEWQQNTGMDIWNRGGGRWGGEFMDWMGGGGLADLTLQQRTQMGSGMLNPSTLGDMSKWTTASQNAMNQWAPRYSQPGGFNAGQYDAYGNPVVTPTQAPDMGGDVYPANLPVDPMMTQLPGMYQSIFDIFTGKAQHPQLAPIMENLAQSQGAQREREEEGLALRGMSNSTPADTLRQQQGVRERGETAATEMGLTSQLLQQQLPALGQFANQNLANRQGALNEWNTFFNAQSQADRDLVNQQLGTLQLYLQGLGGAMPSGGQPGAMGMPTQPGGWESAGGLLGNLLPLLMGGDKPWIFGG